MSAGGHRRHGDRGMVFAGDTDELGMPVLVYLALGLRPPVRPWQPSAYRVADRRLRPDLEAPIDIRLSTRGTIYG